MILVNFDGQLIEIIQKHNITPEFRDPKELIVYDSSATSPWVPANFIKVRKREETEQQKRDKFRKF